VITTCVRLGKGLGKDLGFPTANLKIEETYKLIPKTGVYVVKALIDDEEFFGMMNIGYNPTVGGSEKTIETYFFNLDKNLYGKKLQIEMLKRIREEKKFSGVEELIKAMKEDQAFSENYIHQFKTQ
jgi:riboflavin kinase/FMN adenylyltransferase